MTQFGFVSKNSFHRGCQSINMAGANRPNGNRIADAGCRRSGSYRRPLGILGTRPIATQIGTANVYPFLGSKLQSGRGVRSGACHRTDLTLTTDARRDSPWLRRIHSGLAMPKRQAGPRGPLFSIPRMTFRQRGNRAPTTAIDKRGGECSPRNDPCEQRAERGLIFESDSPLTQSALAALTMSSFASYWTCKAWIMPACSK